jgi:hypothetical protein
VEPLVPLLGQVEENEEMVGLPDLDNEDYQFDFDGV